MTSAYALHQFFLNAEDEKVIEYLKVFSDRSQEEIAELGRQTREAPQLRSAQRALADDVTALVHGTAERDAAIQAADAVFGRSDLRELPESVLDDVAAELGGTQLEANGDLPTVVEVLAAGGVVPNKSAARRAITEGGAYVNNERVTDPDARLAEYDLLHGRYVIVRRGKRTVGAVSIRRS
jgi:tyrosyl-tRNA synthetase